MRRAAFLLTVSLVTVAGVARAQDLRDIQARNAAAQAIDDARRDLLASQIEMSNANERARTQLILRDLNDQRVGVLAAPAAPVLRPLEAPARGDAALSPSMDRLERLTQDALAEGNARMRAIRPASEPKPVKPKS